MVKDWSTENAIVMTNTSPQLNGKRQPAAATRTPARRWPTRPTATRWPRSIGEGVEIPTSPWSPSNPWGMPDDQNGYVDFDLDQAKAEVEEYKKDTGAASLTFTLSGLPGIDDIKVLQLAAEPVEGRRHRGQHRDPRADGLHHQDRDRRLPGRVLPQLRLRRSRTATSCFWSSTTAKGAGTLSINFTQYTSAGTRPGREHRPPERLRQRAQGRPTTTSCTSSTRRPPTSGSTARRTRSSPTPRSRASPRRRPSASATSSRRPGGAISGGPRADRTDQDPGRADVVARSWSDRF